MMPKAQASPQSREAVRAKTLETTSSLIPRRQASLRCPPLEDGRRDPLDPAAGGFRTSPMVMGLRAGELVEEGRRLERTGWREWELAARLGACWWGGGQ